MALRTLSNSERRLHVLYGMNATSPIRCSIAMPGVEVVTFRTESGQLVSEIHGGRLNEETYTSEGGDPDAQHEKACRLVRLAAGDGVRRKRRW